MNIKAIAKEAGVSVSTVSKVINGYSDISKGTREKVLEIIKRFNYQPNQIARVLSTRKSWLIGLIYDVINDYDNEFFNEVIMIFKRIVEENGYNIMFLNTYKIKNENISYLNYCRQYDIEGLLLAGSVDNDVYINELINAEIPCMAIDIDIIGKRAGYVTSDNCGGMLQAIDYLATLGHKKIAFINGTKSLYVSKERLKGFTYAMKKNNLDIVQEWIKYGDYTEKSGYKAMKEILSTEHLPSAVMLASDEMALGAAKAIKEKGMNIPDDMSIIGFDDIRSASIFYPGLTTVKQDKQMLGRFAAISLLNMLNDKSFKAPVIIIPTKLIIRQSTKNK